MFPAPRAGVQSLRQELLMYHWSKYLIALALSEDKGANEQEPVRMLHCASIGKPK